MDSSGKVNVETVLYRLYCLNNELENGNTRAADIELSQLINLLEARLPYVQQEYGHLDRSRVE